MKIIKLSGEDHYQLGLMHGRKLKKEIHAFKDEICKKIQRSFLVFQVIPLDLAVTIAALFLKPKYPRKYLDELRGISEAANIDLKWLLLLNSFLDIGQLATSLGLSDAKWGCSGFLTTDSHQQFILAKTFDLDPADILRKYGCIFHYQCKWLKHSFIIYSFPGLIAGDYYTNSHQLTACFFHGGMSRSYLNFFNDQIAPVFHREFYERAGSIEDACSFFKKEGRPISSFKGIIADQNNHAFMVEIYSKYQVIKKFKNKPMICTNHFENRVMNRHYVKGYRRRKYFLDSVERLNVLKKAVTRNLTFRQAKDILASRNEDNPDGSIANDLTVFAMIKTFVDHQVYITWDQTVPATITKRYRKVDLSFNK